MNVDFTPAKTAHYAGYDIIVVTTPQGKDPTAPYAWAVYKPESESAKPEIAGGAESIDAAMFCATLMAHVMRHAEETKNADEEGRPAPTLLPPPSPPEGLTGYEATAIAIELRETIIRYSASRN